VDPEADIGLDVQDNPVPLPLPGPELRQIAAEVDVHIGEAERRRDLQFALLDAAVDFLQDGEDQQEAEEAFHALVEVIVEGNKMRTLYADDYVVWDEYGELINSELEVFG
jgi:hypothetical protein